ncbi:hypothetical protein ACFSKW_29040 [Nonomuraea mangrovi]|uniref:Transposase n=1 Tax=Nonomuraea mangrovi TaxID=2316207 RepID=A0ABW4T2R2_9ACTN
MAVDRERRAATVTRLIALRTAGTLTTEHVRLAARGLKVTERTIWRWLDEQSRTPPQQARTGQPGCRAYALTPIDREAFVYLRGNVAAVHRARAAVADGTITGESPGT